MTLEESMFCDDDYLMLLFDRQFENKTFFCCEGLAIIPAMQQIVVRFISFLRDMYMNVVIEKADDEDNLNVFYEIWKEKHSIIVEDVFLGESSYKFPADESLDDIDLTDTLKNDEEVKAVLSGKTRSLEETKCQS